MKLKMMMSAAALMLAASAQATVLDFEGLTTAGAVDLNSTVSNYGGFNWSSAAYLYNTSSYGVPVSSGSYGVVNNFGVNPFVVSSSVAFDFNGVWLDGWSFNSPSAITISGYDSANNLVGSINQAVSFGPGSFVTANFNGVSRVEFTGGQYFEIDDFTFNQRGVAEPSAVMLLGLGLLGLGVARRRKAA